MKAKLFYGIVVLFVFFGCRKEMYQPRYNLFLTFEKDGVQYLLEGNEVSHRPAFGKHLIENEGISSTTFILKSWCAFEDTLNQNQGVTFHVNFFQFDTSHLITQSGLDEMFSEGIKDLDNSPIVLTGNSIVHSIGLQYIERHPVYTNYSNLCDGVSESVFEITSFEKLNSEDSIYSALIEADFKLTLCSADGRKVKLENGRLKYYYCTLN